MARAVEWHPRYGGEDLAPAESAMDEVVDRLQARGVATRSQVSRVLAGAGPRVLAADVTEFGADLLIVDDHGTQGPLRALGLGLAGRLAPEVPRPGHAAPAARAAPRLRVVR